MQIEIIHTVSETFTVPDEEGNRLLAASRRRMLDDIVEIGDYFYCNKTGNTNMDTFKVKRIVLR